MNVFIPFSVPSVSAPSAVVVREVDVCRSRIGHGSPIIDRPKPEAGKQGARSASLSDAKARMFDELKFESSVFPGAVFGRLTAMYSFAMKHGSEKRNRKTWVLRCSCGAEVKSLPRFLFSKETVSCGCFRRDMQMESHGSLERTGRNQEKILTYNSWKNMIDRCYNQSAGSFARYGGKGITVARRWHNFGNFLADMGERKCRSISIDRYPNNNGNYEPGNCRWATREEQDSNKSTNVHVERNGERLTLSQWEKRFSLPRGIIRARLKLGWPVGDRIFRKPRATIINRSHDQDSHAESSTVGER